MAQILNLLTSIVSTVKKGLTRCPDYFKDSFRVVSKKTPHLCLNKILNIPLRVLDLIDFVTTVSSYFALVSEMDYNFG